MKLIFPVFILLILTGCATVKLSDKLPTPDQLAELTPEQFREQFSELDKQNLVRSDIKPELLQSHFGSADSVEKEWGAYSIEKLSIASIFYFAFSNDLPVALGYSSLLFLLNPKVPDKYSWSIGDYRLHAYSFKRLFDDKPGISRWEWQHRSSSETDYVDIFHQRENKPYYFKVQLSQGGDTLARRNDGSRTYHTSDSTHISLGYRFFADEELSFRLSAGYEYSGFLITEEDVSLTQIPIEAAIAFRPKNHTIEFAVGAGYLYSPELEMHTVNAGDVTVEFNSSYSGFLEMEYQIQNRFALGFRVEMLSYRAKDKLNERLNGNNFAVYQTFYF